MQDQQNKTLNYTLERNDTFALGLGRLSWLLSGTQTPALPWGGDGLILGDSLLGSQGQLP